ncbi:capsular biosynthesis protein [Leuconostoc gelidum subsp. gasicomitatum]|uniref:YveK family protein n=1 Tax=Leuconostoc gelidum group TaxID=3016637 RepID=UPI001CC77119|nr:MULTISPECIES: Wzz/FepE/Etk N-terminal domain-containing protein [Leuconostoc gelidum group]MBZ5964370.1 capsular biosynthesis protein [Leuconostoc gelidum subsp. gelidum]MBZ5996171.1 capsular biosynthesis protein [Leuconostoc gasicomitatum]
MNNVLELRQLWDIIRKHFIMLVLMAIIGGAIGFGIARFVIAPTYSASTSMLVNRTTDNAQTTANLSDQQADVQIINTYKNLVTSSNVLGDVANTLKKPDRIVVQKYQPAVFDTLADGTRRLVTPEQKEVTRASSQKKYDLTVDELKAMVSISNQQNSQVFAINVKSNDPKQAAQIANTVADSFKDKIGNFMKINNVSIIDSAKTPESPVSPNKKLFALAGLVILGGLTFLIVLVRELSDTTIKSPDDVTELFGMTNLGVIGHIKSMKHFDISRKAETESHSTRSRVSRLNREEG